MAVYLDAVRRGAISSVCNQSLAPGTLRMTYLPYLTSSSFPKTQHSQAEKCTAQRLIGFSVTLQLGISIFGSLFSYEKQIADVQCLMLQKCSK